MHGAILAHGGKLVPHAVKWQNVKKVMRMLKDFEMEMLWSAVQCNAVQSAFGFL